MTQQSIGLKFFAKMMRGSCASYCASGISFNPTSHLNFSDSFQLEEKP